LPKKDVSWRGGLCCAGIENIFRSLLKRSNEMSVSNIKDKPVTVRLKQGNHDALATKDDSFSSSTRITPLRIFPNFVKMGNGYQLMYVSE
jgi:hypothetical protein